jgi:hypothetical protein
MTLVLALPAIAGGIINTTDSNIAINGYDSVSYFTDSRPVKGDPTFELNWQGARWLFANADHRDVFASDPQRYAPRYGGFCAGAMALGWKAPIDPEAWVIIDGRLYLNYAKDAVKGFVANSDERIAKANANWVRLRTAE